VCQSALDARRIETSYVPETIHIHCCFCDPYAAWQRGTNENRNELIRRCFPKGTEFARLTQAAVERAESAINNRPMKCLGNSTPLEAAVRFVAFRA
jgi:transposase, IS30 family